MAIFTSVTGLILLYSHWIAGNKTPSSCCFTDSFPCFYLSLPKSCFIGMQHLNYYAAAGKNKNNGTDTFQSVSQHLQFVAETN